MYLKKNDDSIIYPYTIGDLKRDNPNVSFPRGVTDEILEGFGMHRVLPIELDIDYRLDYTELTPVLSGSSYIQSWEITSSSLNVVSTRIEQKWEDVRKIRNELLVQSDWTQFGDSPITGSKLEEWRLYRQSLRDITLQENPFELTWPIRP